MTPGALTMITNHRELVKTLQKRILVFTVLYLSEFCLRCLPSVLAGMWIKIIHSLLAYVLLLRCLFMWEINVACSLQLVFILLMTGSHKMACTKIWKLMALTAYTYAQTQIWRKKPNQ